MRHYIFYGSVLPERALMNLEVPPMEFDGISIILKCCFSKLALHCVSGNQSEDLEILKNKIESFVRTFVDSFGYTVATGFDVQIESVLDLSTNQFTLFGVHEKIFDNAINDITGKGVIHPELSFTFSDMAKVACIDIQLRIALADFRDSIRRVELTSFHCYRAIEALCQTFSADWENFRESLGVDKDDIFFVKKGKADVQRHGKMVDQPREVRKKCMQITWDIIRKYVDSRVKKDLSSATLVAAISET